MKTKHYKALQRFCNNTRKIQFWVRDANLDEIIAMYYSIKNEYYELAGTYAHKAEYKTIRILFIRHCAEKLSTLKQFWDEIPNSLCVEILCKSEQKLIPAHTLTSNSRFEIYIKQRAIEADYPNKPHLMSCYGEKPKRTVKEDSDL